LKNGSHGPGDGALIRSLLRDGFLGELTLMVYPPPPDPPFGGCSSTGSGGTLLGKSYEQWLCAPVTGGENRRKRNTEMIRVTVEIRDGALTNRVRVTAPSIERALEIAGDGMPSRQVRLLFPIDAVAFFVPEDPGRREAA
jgi:hypothetical protein